MWGFYSSDYELFLFHGFFVMYPSRRPKFATCFALASCWSRRREYGRGDPLRRPRDTLYPQKLALLSLKSGGRSVGIVSSRTKAMEFFSCFFHVGSILDHEHRGSMCLRNLVCLPVDHRRCIWEGRTVFTKSSVTYTWYYGSTALCCAMASFAVSWSCTQSAGLLGRGISSSQGTSTHRAIQAQNKQTSIPRVAFEARTAVCEQATRPL
jgi:hypothetical protein